MLTTVTCGAITGINAAIVKVEVDMAMGLPAFAIVGLPEGAVKESKVRVQAALGNVGYAVPPKKITVNLAPADLKKTGAAFDLAIAAGLLCGAGLVSDQSLKNTMIIGELGLDGSCRSVPGALPYVLAARENKINTLIIASDNAKEAAVIKEVNVIPVKNLDETVLHLTGENPIAPHPVTRCVGRNRYSHLDLSEVRGQEHAKRALEVAAAGSHNIMMIGPPGSGKTMLAKRLASILPPLTFEEILEVSAAHSVLGLTGVDNPLITSKPFRSPHHTVSDAGLIGGSNPPKPGEVSLAHNGILFLDEMPEFKRNALEVLREPLEEGEITISRAAGRATFPASFNLVASMNPCPCGYFGSEERPCICNAASVERYRNKISGPLLDRIDIHIEVPAVKVTELTKGNKGEPSADVLSRVRKARDRQHARLKSCGLSANGDMGIPQIEAHCKLDPSGSALLERAIEKRGLSARAFSRILKVARTIADLDDAPTISTAHLAEAIGYRSLDKKGV